MKKKLIIIISVVVIIVSMITIIGVLTWGGGTGGDAGLVGISLPTQSEQHWVDDGNNLVAQLGELDFGTILKYAGDDVTEQAAQIEDMISQGVDVLVIAAVDGGALTAVLEDAAAEDITVIAYDRLIMDTPHVSYFTTFNSFAIGAMQANAILSGLGIDVGETGPFNIELFGGSRDDNNAYFLYDAAMSVLQPYISDGTLVVRSNELGMEIVGTIDWDARYARERMEGLLADFYGEARIDAVLSPYDNLSLGIISALRDAGYGTDSQPWPVVSGRDAIVESVQSIIDGEQHSTVLRDSRDLVAATVRIIQYVLAEGESPINDTTTYDNNIFVVPSVVLEIVHIDINNWHEALIGTEYYTEDMFTLDSN